MRTRLRPIRVRPRSLPLLLRLAPWLLLGLASAPVRAQEVEFAPTAGRAGERELDLFLEQGEYELWSTDTVLAADARVEGNLLILQATARIAGEVTGTVFVVDGDLFLRPGARVAGDAFVLGGGYYGSSMASIEGDLTYRPDQQYRVVPRAGGYLIVPVRRVPPPIELHGLYGFKAPLYQRVNGLTLAWGVTGRVTAWPWRPSLEIVVRVHTEQGELEGSAKQYWHPGEFLRLGLEAERVTVSNEGWARGAFSNSLSYFFLGDDFRDHYRSDRAAFVVGRSGEAVWSPSLRVQWERARSLEARKQFVLFGTDEVRENPAIDDGETWSAVLALAVEQRSADSRLAAAFTLEASDSTIAGDFSFVLGEAHVRWNRPVLLGHRLDAFALVRGDLAGTLPRQRWSAFGGRPTLPTFPILGFRGPRLVFGQLSYLIPIEPLRLGAMGAPAVFARAATGAAWGVDESAAFKTNLVGGARVWVLEVAVAVDPGAADLDPNVYALLSLPGDL